MSNDQTTLHGGPLIFEIDQGTNFRPEIIQVLFLDNQGHQHTISVSRNQLEEMLEEASPEEEGEEDDDDEETEDEDDDDEETEDEDDDDEETEDDDDDEETEDDDEYDDDDDEETEDDDNGHEEDDDNDEETEDDEDDDNDEDEEEEEEENHQNLIEKLEKVVMIEEFTMCSICLEKITPSNKREEGGGGAAVGIPKPCGHIYHHECILKWLINHNTCPLCRYKITS